MPRATPIFSRVSFHANSAKHAPLLSEVILLILHYCDRVAWLRLIIRRSEESGRPPPGAPEGRSTRGRSPRRGRRRVFLWIRREHFQDCVSRRIFLPPPPRIGCAPGCLEMYDAFCKKQQAQSFDQITVSKTNFKQFQQKHVV